MSNEEKATMPTATKLEETQVNRAGPCVFDAPTEQVAKQDTLHASQESPLVASLRAHFKKWYVRDKVLGEMEIIDSTEEAA